MTHDELIQVLLEEAFENIKSGKWTQKEFKDWYFANVLEAQSQVLE